MNATREGVHPGHVATAREAVASHGLVIVDELPLGPLHGAMPRSLGPSDYVATRLAVDDGRGALVHLVVVTTEGDPEPNLGTGDELRYYSLDEFGVLLSYTRSTPPLASNAEVARVYELATSGGGAPALVLADLDESAEVYGDRLRRVVRSALDPEGHPRDDVLAATAVLEDLVAGAPLEWALRRVTARAS